MVINIPTQGHSIHNDDPCRFVQVNSCKRNMNTFAFVGDLANHPEVSCVYHSEDAENAFLKDPRQVTFDSCLDSACSITMILHQYCTCCQIVLLHM